MVLREKDGIDYRLVRKTALDLAVSMRACPAGICTPLIKYIIDFSKCVGCAVCKKMCPNGAISGEKKEVHRIDWDKCDKCDICISVCKPNAIIKI